MTDNRESALVRCLGTSIPAFLSNVLPRYGAALCRPASTCSARVWFPELLTMHIGLRGRAGEVMEIDVHTESVSREFGPYDWPRILLVPDPDVVDRRLTRAIDTCYRYAVTSWRAPDDGSETDRMHAMLAAMQRLRPGSVTLSSHGTFVAGWGKLLFAPGGRQITLTDSRGGGALAAHVRRTGVRGSGHEC